MKSLIKRLFLAVEVSSLFVIGFITANAEEKEAEVGNPNYFYSLIAKDEKAKKFYDAFSYLQTSDEFKNGKIEYDLIEKNILSKDDVLGVLNKGETKIQKTFAAGRDSYYMDHPDLFYVDVFGTSLSFGQQGSEPVAFLDSSRVLDLYVGDLKNSSTVESAIKQYDDKLNEIVASAKAAGDKKSQIEYVNKYIVEHTEYSFGTIVENGRNMDTPAAAYISTAFGSIVNGKAICGGYAKGFKAVMDRLGIPCVCVQGYAKAEENANFEAHMWNYVQLDGLWYAVDVTWNDTSKDIDKLLLVGADTLFATHSEDEVISTSGFELKYPAIKPYDYGVDEDKNGMSITGEYIDINGEKNLEFCLSYENKGASELEKEGKYITFRTGFTDPDTKKITWGVWMNVLRAWELLAFNVKNEDTQLYMQFPAGIEYIQFGLADYEPDSNTSLNGYPAFYPNEPDRYGDKAGKPLNYGYKNITDDHFIGGISSAYKNEANNTFEEPAPGGIGVPSNSAPLPVNQTHKITIVYNVSLMKIDETKEVGMDFTISRGDDQIKQYAKVEDVQWDGDRTITFTFTPSKMFIHNQALYYFVPTNIIGVKSEKVPHAVTYSFKGKSAVCSKIFNDGRLFINVYGEPKMIDNSDVSITDFKDENGNYYAESQRSQLILVASKPDSATEDQMEQVLKDEMSIKSDEIITSASYEINLQICGVIKQVPNGSYMQVSFGFPEGFSKDDEGTTFKIYHYKHDDKGNITGVEEIPVVVTEYGLIAKVKSFSPFIVVQLKNTSAAVKNTNKTIYASVNGHGGTITTDGKSGIAEVTSESITYSIQALEGYQISSVALNGKVLDPSRYVNASLTLTAE